MALDPNIILRGSAMQQEIQQQNNAGLQKLIGTLGQIGYDSKVRKMRQLEKPEDQQAFVNNSLFANKLNTQLSADRAAAAKAAADQLKFDADLNKTYAETNKLGSESGKIATETGITRQNNAATMWNAYLTGGAGAAKAVLEGMKARGLIDDTNYQAELAALTDLDGKTAAEQQQYALGRFKGVQDAKYSLTTEDNVLDNRTSADNNIRTTQASRYSTDKDYQLGQQELQVKQALEQQKINIEQNQGEVVAGADGMGYIFYPNRPAGQRYEPLLGQDGKHAKAPAKSSGGQGRGMSATAQKELFETDDAITAGQSGISNLKQALQLSKNSYDGVGATQRATIAGNVPGGLFVDEEVAKNTVLLNNIVTGNALEMLKSTFGGAPTEGERQILLQLQGSANLPRAQREAIYEKAIQAAERRLATNQQKAASLRNGTYFGDDEASTTPTQNLGFMP